MWNEFRIAQGDRVFQSFLRRQYDEGMALAASSDILELFPIGSIAGDAPSAYIARFNCRGLVRGQNGVVTEADRFEVMIAFPPGYLRRAEPMQVVSWLGPPGVFHPNISARLPVICLGKLGPGTPLVDILYQCYEVITYNKVTMREDDALNTDACAWARANRDKFPIDRRPLKRRTLSFDVTQQGEGIAQ